MLDRAEIDKQLKAFQQRVIKQSRSNLTRLKKNSSNNLYKSLKGSYKVNPNSIELDFEMLPYGQFQDKGVKGVKSGSSLGGFKFGTGTGQKGGLTAGINKWVQNRRLQFRDRSGRFLSYDSTAFIIRRSIWNKGIKPSLFFTKPFENEYKKLSGELIESFGLDVEKLMDFSLENLKK